MVDRREPLLECRPYAQLGLDRFRQDKGTDRCREFIAKTVVIAYEQLVISSLQDVEGALVAYFEEQKRTIDFENQVAADRRSLVLTEDLFEAGLIDESQVLAALRTLIDSENSLVQSQQALTGDLIAVYKAMGGDWECSSSP
jgi:outer membrane protein, multidrug efflux system